MRKHARRMATIAAMSRRTADQVPASADPFEVVRTVGLALPHVEATSKYDGSPLLKVFGSFMAGVATHRFAEPATLVVRVDLEQRECLLQDAPQTMGWFVVSSVRITTLIATLTGVPAGPSSRADAVRTSSDFTSKRSRSVRR